MKVHDQLVVTRETPVYLYILNLLSVPSCHTQFCGLSGIIVFWLIRYKKIVVYQVYFFWLIRYKKLERWLTGAPAKAGNFALLSTSPLSTSWHLQNSNLLQLLSSCFSTFSATKEPDVKLKR